jgi:hypothetical protein
MLNAHETEGVPASAILAGTPSRLRDEMAFRFRTVGVPMEDSDDTDWTALERLLKAAHNFADGHKAGIPKEELEKVRLEFAKALEMMEDRSH